MRRRASRSRLIAIALASVTAVALLAFGSPVPVRAWDAGTFSAGDEQLLFTLTNQARAASGLAPLRWDVAVAGVARWRSQDMSVRNYFSHEIPPDNYLVFHYLDQRGISYVLAGENIGWIKASDDQATPAIQDMFMNSPTHREIILGKQWDSIGIGAYKGADGVIKYTVLFKESKAASGTPKPTRAPTPAPRPTPRPTSPPPATAIPRETRAPVIRTPGPVPTPAPTRRSTPTPTSTPAPQAPSPGVVAVTPRASTTPPTAAASTPGRIGTPPAPPRAGSQRIRDDAPPAGLLETIIGSMLSLLPAR